MGRIRALISYDHYAIGQLADCNKPAQVFSIRIVFCFWHSLAFILISFAESWELKKNVGKCSPTRWTKKVAKT